MKNIALYCLLILFFSDAAAEISRFLDCKDGILLEDVDGNLTKAERIHVFDTRFNTEIADIEACIKQSGASSSSNPSSSSSAAPLDSSSNPSSSSSAFSSSSFFTRYLSNLFQSDSVAEDKFNERTAGTAPNLLTDGEKSLSVDSSLQSVSENNAFWQTNKDASQTDNGKNHEKLQQVDNKRLLAEKILERAKNEQNPAIKKALMERYNDLTK